MVENRKIKKNKEVLSRLNSGKAASIINAIGELRVIGNVNYLPDIFNTYHERQDVTVKHEIANFISDLKDENAADYIVNFIKDIKNEEDVSLYVSSCWQSRVKFTRFTGFFIDLIAGHSYQTSVEAFTVIENCLPDIDKDTIKQHVQTLKSNINRANKEKKLFVLEIIKILGREI